MLGNQYSGYKHSFNPPFSHPHISPPQARDPVLPTPKSKPLVFCPSWGRGSSGPRGKDSRIPTALRFQPQLLLEVPEPFQGSQCKPVACIDPWGVRCSFPRPVKSKVCCLLPASKMLLLSRPLLFSLSLWL